MSITENDLDQLARHTLRIELLNGMVLIYGIEVDQKQQLIGRFRSNSDGTEEHVRPIKFVWFETSLKRQVIINVSDIARVTFCYDYLVLLEEPDAYFDNFKVLEKDTTLVEEATAEGNKRIHVLTQEFLPSAILYHKGVAPEVGIESNPLLYYDLPNGCLGLFGLELEDEIPMRQFINFIDMDGEENFIPTNQIIVLEFEENLLYDADNEEDEEEDEDENTMLQEVEFDEFDEDELKEYGLDNPTDSTDQDNDNLPF
jgi:hypothetical protein